MKYSTSNTCVCAIRSSRTSFFFFYFNLLRSELLTKTIIFHAASGLLTGNPESVLPHRLQRKLGLFLLM